MEGRSENFVTEELHKMLAEAEEEIESGLPLLDADIVFAELESKYFNNGEKLFKYE